MRNKVLALRYLAKSRLPTLTRWRDVDVVTTKDKKKIDENQYLREYATDDNKVYICWHGNKSVRNTNDFEIREVPLEDIDNVIERTAIRLKNKSKPYR